MGKDGLSLAKLGSIPEREFESDLARGACSPRHLRLYILWHNTTYTVRKCSEAIPGRDGTKCWLGGEKRKENLTQFEIIIYH